MAIKFKISKATYEKLPDELKEHYLKDDKGDGYTADVDGIDDASELKDSLENEKRQHKETKKARAKAESRVTELEEERSEGATNAEEVRRTLTEKHTRELEKRDGVINNLKGGVGKSAKDSLVADIAKKLFKTPKFAESFLGNRVKVEVDDEGTVTTSILSSDGKGTMKREDFEKELTEDKELADNLIGSRASGGGAPSSPPPAGGRRDSHQNDPANPGKPVDYSRMKPGEFASQIKANREAAKQAS